MAELLPLKVYLYTLSPMLHCKLSQKFLSLQQFTFYCDVMDYFLFFLPPPTGASEIDGLLGASGAELLVAIAEPECHFSQVWKSPTNQLLQLCTACTVFSILVAVWLHFMMQEVCCLLTSGKQRKIYIHLTDQ